VKGAIGGSQYFIIPLLLIHLDALDICNNTFKIYAKNISLIIRFDDREGNKLFIINLIEFIVFHFIDPCVGLLLKIIDEFFNFFLHLRVNNSEVFLDAFMILVAFFIVFVSTQ
jgi:hypothetical protein